MKWIDVAEFEWDEGNIRHIARHQVVPEEAEEIFINHPLVRVTREGRLIAFGQTDNGRYLTVVFMRKANNMVRVITAREMTDAEYKLYRKERG